MSGDDPAPEPRFGGAGVGWLDEPVDAPGELATPPRPRWVVLLEQAFVQLTSTPEGRERYGDPQRGATVEQAWRTRGLLGAPAVCLVTTRFGPVRTGEIPDVVTLAPDVLATTLARIVARPRTSVQVLLFDGRQGHAVTLLGAVPERDAVVYHDPWPPGNDPWPEGTLLAAGRNEAGVAAERHGSRWLVRRDELERVAYAAFVDPGAWRVEQGRDAAVTLGALEQSDLWSWFGLREVQRGDGPDGLVRVHVAPGAFQDAVGIGLELEPPDRIRVARLTLRRAWLAPGEERLEPLAQDIAASFLRALAPPPERPGVEPVAALVAALGRGDAVRRLLDDDPGLEAFARAWAGAPEVADRRLELCSASIANEGAEDDRWLVVQVTTS